ncbi:hypothetical protein GOC55_13085 [Sinorhizobium medicae]|nr:hypothetical protein [Sinorhizobium medicae]
MNVFMTLMESITPMSKATNLVASEHLDDVRSSQLRPVVSVMARRYLRGERCVDVTVYAGSGGVFHLEIANGRWAENGPRGYDLRRLRATFLKCGSSDGSTETAILLSEINCRYNANRPKDYGHVVADKAADPRETELNSLSADTRKLDFKAALDREAWHIESVHRFLNGLIMTFDREGKQMPCFQGEATEILPLLAACGWKGTVQWSELKERTSP